MNCDDEDRLPSRLLRAIENNDLISMPSLLEQLKQHRTWTEFFNYLQPRLCISPEIKDLFHTHWTECGHIIRQCVANDVQLVVALKVVLPRYRGPELLLYRGESVERWKAGQLGLCWTTQQATAQIFACGLNAIEPYGGVMLSALAAEASIIASPGAHSNWLGEAEYVVDPSRLTEIKPLEFHPASH